MVFSTMPAGTPAFCRSFITSSGLCCKVQVSTSSFSWFSFIFRLVIVEYFGLLTHAGWPTALQKACHSSSVNTLMHTTGRHLDSGKRCGERRNHRNSLSDFRQHKRRDNQPDSAQTDSIQLPAGKYPVPGLCRSAFDNPTHR